MAIVNSYSLVAFKELHGNIKLGKSQEYSTSDGKTFTAKSLYAQHPTETVKLDDGRTVAKRTFISWAKAIDANTEGQWLKDNINDLQIVETDEFDTSLNQPKYFICLADETII